MFFLGKPVSAVKKKRYASSLIEGNSYGHENKIVILILFTPTLNFSRKVQNEHVYKAVPNP